MDTLIQDIQERWMAYAGLAACALPLMFIFRRFVFPAIWYAVEIAFYLASMHTLLHFIVRLLRWFKYESTFGALGEKVDTGWQTPLFEFWHWHLYNPRVLLYMEAVSTILILYLVWRFRPYKAQKPSSRTFASKKGLASSVRPVQKRSEAHR